MEKRSVYLMVAVVILAQAALLAFFLYDPHGRFYLLYVAFDAPAIAVAIVSFVSRVRIGIAPGTPEQVLSTMSLNFRMAQYRVTNKGQSIVVQHGANIGIRIYAKGIGPNSLVQVKSDPTPSGWGVLIIVFLFTYGIGTTLYSLYLFRKSQKFGAAVIPTMYKGPGVTITPEVPSKTKACLIDTLSEGYRLSSEAYEAAKSNFEDNVVLGIIGGIVSAPLVFFLAILAIGGGVSWTQEEGAIAIVLALVVGLGIPLITYYHLMKNWWPKVMSFQTWSDRLRKELSEEVSSRGPRDRHTSTFEVILDAYRELPVWLQVRRKSVLYRSPVLLTVILVMVLYGSSFAMTAVFSPWDWPAKLALVAVSLALVFTGLLVYVRWKRNEEQDAQKVQETWSRRSDAIQRKMDEIVRGL